jgi:3-deoxy-D-manno-octulosonic acid kinase
MQQAHELTTGGGILYDPSRVSKPNAALFDAHAWRTRANASSVSGGRGSVLFINHGEDRWVLRHYRRGGLIAKFNADRYVWSGPERTRSFRESRLLAEMRRLGLPVPAPIAARYERNGLLYRADIITEEILGARTLAQIIADDTLGVASWQQVGATIARFHRHGIRHADLNAHNIMIANETVYLLDFDRGRQCPRGTWEQQVLVRLRRSLDKIKRQQPALCFGASDWMSLMEGYERGAARVEG